MNTENKLLQYIYQKYNIEDIKDLEDKLLELSSIYDVNQRFLSAKDVSEIADLLLLVPMGRFLISKIYMVLKVEDDIIISRKGKWRISDNIIQMLFKTNFPRPSSINEVEAKLPEIISDELRQNKVNLIIPLLFHDERMGFVLVGSKMDQSPYTLSEVQTLMTIFNMNTPFLLNLYMLDSLKKKNIELANHVQILKTILETSANLDSLFDKQQVINLFLLTLMGRLTITRYEWITCDDIHESGDYSVLAKKKISLTREEVLTITQKLKQKSKDPVEPLLLTEIIPDKKYSGYLLIPFFKESRIKSILILGPKFSKQSWTALEMDFASILLAQVMHILENLELLEEKIEKELMEKELSVARSIQNQLLPANIPVISSLELIYYNEPSRQVGGDYCDIIRKNNYLYVAIADVSGKSVPAALIMSHVQSALHILTDFDLELNEIVFRLNNQLCENTATDKFVTMFLSRIDLNNFQMEFINAGHNPPLLLKGRTGELTKLEEGGLLLGMMKNVPFEIGNIPLESDDLLFMYTDGVTETLNADEKEWGEDNLINFLKDHARLPASQFKTRLLNNLKNYSGNKEIADDDITFVYIKKH